jgi:hypothetical protein
MRRTIHTEITLPADFRNVVLAPQVVDWAAPDGAGNIRVETGWRVPASPPEPGKTAGAKAKPGAAGITGLSAAPPSGAVLDISQEVDLHPAVIGADENPGLLDLDARLSETLERMVLLEETPAAGEPAAEK